MGPRSLPITFFVVRAYFIRLFSNKPGLKWIQNDIKFSFWAWLNAAKILGFERPITWNGKSPRSLNIKFSSTRIYFYRTICRPIRFSKWYQSGKIVFLFVSFSKLNKNLSPLSRGSFTGVGENTKIYPHAPRAYFSPHSISHSPYEKIGGLGEGERTKI